MKYDHGDLSEARGSFDSHEEAMAWYLFIIAAEQINTRKQLEHLDKTLRDFETTTETQLYNIHNRL